MSETGDRAKRVAVIAIHGVGDHPAFATAREIGDLLSNLEYEPPKKDGAEETPALSPPRYSPFSEVTKRINVRGVKVEGSMRGHRHTWGLMDAMEKDSHQHRRSPLRRDAADNAPDSLDHLFMWGQLCEYKGENPEDTYQCLRLEGKRMPTPRAPTGDIAGDIDDRLQASGVDVPVATPDTEEKAVHIYEMYWADLSGGANVFTRIFGELYQLLFHLGSVSVNNVLAAALDIHGRSTEKAQKKWHTFASAQRLTAAILAWPIPMLNLLMAAVVPAIVLVSMMRVHLSAQGEYVALDALLGLLALVGVGAALSKTSQWPGVLYPVPLLLLLGAALGLGFVPTPWTKDTTEIIFATLALALGLAGGWAVVSAYDKQRPGSKPVAIRITLILALAMAVVFAICGVPAGGMGKVEYPAIAVCLNVMEVAFDLLGVAWVAFFASFLWAHATGWAALRALPKEDAQKVKARRTQWTARLILALSSMVFILLTVSLWTGVAKFAAVTLPGEENAEKAKTCVGDACAPLRYRPVAAALYQALWEHRPEWVTTARGAKLAESARTYMTSPPAATEWAGQILLAPGVGFLPVVLIGLVAAFVIAIWAMFPSLMGELSPPLEAAAGEAEAQGVWLDRGFRFMRWAGELLYWIMWLPVLILGVLNFSAVEFIRRHWDGFRELIAIVGTVVAGAAVGVFGFSGRLKSLAGGLRPVLRVMLDVDNWMREHPRESNPTARICGRYVSLLRHILAWQDSDEKKSQYDAIVIVAHSQGTVITADFLRFLHAEKEKAGGSMGRYDPELARLDEVPVYFFSMGCPLHQLYGLRFPFLYGWARNDVAHEEIPAGATHHIGKEDAPRPDRLGVERWTNAYRSGDYVGRYLWRGGRPGYEWSPAATKYDEDWDPPAGKPEKVSADKAGTRIEFCVGPGAHTHYWDHTAQVIAEVLDREIRNAGVGKNR